MSGYKQEICPCCGEVFDAIYDMDNDEVIERRCPKCAEEYREEEEK
jgi:predicted amidophosphoribosyltransferase